MLALGSLDLLQFDDAVERNDGGEFLGAVVEKLGLLFVAHEPTARPVLHAAEVALAGQRVRFQHLAGSNVEDTQLVVLPQAELHHAQPLAVARQRHAHVIVGDVLRARHRADDGAIGQIQALRQNRLLAANEGDGLAFLVRLCFHPFALWAPCTSIRARRGRACTATSPPRD